jgi:predicted nucleotidyltransferase
MAIILELDLEAVASVCRAHGVSTLTIFGSATSARFDQARSDVDFLVDFLPGSQDAFADYFGLKEDLESMFGRPVDLVMANAIRNPYFAAAAADGAEQVYAA